MIGIHFAGFPVVDKGATESRWFENDATKEKEEATQTVHGL